jgi:hypothetical protein
MYARKRLILLQSRGRIYLKHCSMLSFEVIGSIIFFWYDIMLCTVMGMTLLGFFYSSEKLLADMCMWSCY